MKRPRGVIAVAVFAVGATLLCGCATIQMYETLQQPTRQELQAHLNGIIFRIERSSDLPNAFGRADVWGGKVDRGYLELRYVGLTEDGRLVLWLTDVETRSDETTMSRYGVATVHGTATNTGATAVVVGPREGRTEVLPPNTVELTFDPTEGALVLGNIEVTFGAATPYNVTYRLRELRRVDADPEVDAQP